jgi:hypothetical protein
MARKFALVVAVTMSLLVAREALAVGIPATDWDSSSVIFGSPIPGFPELSDVPFINDDGQPIGEMDDRVRLGSYDDGVTVLSDVYWYIHLVTPDELDITRFSTQFPVSGFTGIAGWRFHGWGSSESAGGSGTSADFDIQLTDFGRLEWNKKWTGNTWGPAEPIKFFYGSFHPPGLGTYSIDGSDQGEGDSWAPTPEPGSLALLGSGLAALYGSVRRRRSQKA